MLAALKRRLRGRNRDRKRRKEEERIAEEQRRMWLRAAEILRERAEEASLNGAG